MVLAVSFEEPYRCLTELLLEIIKAQGEQIRELNGGRRKQMSKAQRLRLAMKAALVPEIAAVTFCPDTFLRWYRNYVGKIYDGSAKRGGGGRPTIPEETRDLILDLAKDNPTWVFVELRVRCPS